MKKLWPYFLTLLLSFALVGCGEEKFTTPGYVTLFNYCESSDYLSQKYIKVIDTERKYYHEYVCVESNSVYDYIVIGVACPTNNSIYTTWIDLQLKKDQNICTVKIKIPSKPYDYGEIDLKTFSPDNHIIDGCSVGSLYGSFLSNALIALEPTLKTKVGISLKDLGFKNY